MAEINEEGIIVSDNSIYVPQTWVDEVDVCTPISAERLNHMELGMCDIAERCDSLSHGKIKDLPITTGFGGWIDVTFPHPYQTPPTVLLSLEHSGGLNRSSFPVVRTGIVRTDGFRCIVHSNGYSEPVTVNWMAIGA